MMKKTILAAFLGLSIAGGVVACDKKNTPAERTASGRTLSDRLDRLENDWIRLKGEIEGKSEIEQELAVLKDEIDEELKSARKTLEKLGDKTQEHGSNAEDALEKAISDLEKSINKAKKDLG